MSSLSAQSAFTALRTFPAQILSELPPHENIIRCFGFSIDAPQRSGGWSSHGPWPQVSQKCISLFFQAAAAW